MRSNVIAGIDVGTNTIKVVVAEFPLKKAPRILGTGRSISRGLRQGYVTDIARAAQSIREAVREAESVSKVKIKEALASIGGITLESETSKGSAVISRADKEVTERDLNKALAESEENLKIINRHILHELPISFKLDGKEVLGDPVGMKGIKLEVKNLFVSVLEQHFENLLGAVEEAGIKVVDAIASPIAESMAVLSEKQRSVGCVLINIGSETLSVSVFENSVPISLGIYALGSADITNDIALGLKIPLEEAEKIKTKMLRHDYPQKKLEDITNARLEDIFEIVEDHLRKIGRGGLLPAGAVISGGGAQIENIEEEAKKMLNLPAMLGENRIFKNPKERRGLVWGVALGLCASGKQMYGGRIPRRGGGSFSQFFRNFFDQFLP